MVDLSPERRYVEAKVNDPSNTDTLGDFSNIKNTTQPSLKLNVDDNSITFTAIGKQGTQADIKVTSHELGVDLKYLETEMTLKLSMMMAKPKR